MVGMVPEPVLTALEKQALDHDHQRQRVTEVVRYLAPVECSNRGGDSPGVGEDRRGTYGGGRGDRAHVLGAAEDWEPPPPIPFVVDRPFYFFIRDHRT